MYHGIHIKALRYLIHTNEHNPHIYKYNKYYFKKLAIIYFRLCVFQEFALKLAFIFVDIPEDPVFSSRCNLCFFNFFFDAILQPEFKEGHLPEHNK